MLAPSTTTPSVLRAVGARRMPGHAHHLRAVVAKICGPPILAVGHQPDQVDLECGVIERLEFFDVIEILTQRIRLAGMLVQQFNSHLLGPPIVVGGAAAGNRVKGAFGLVGHESLRGLKAFSLWISCQCNNLIYWIKLLVFNYREPGTAARMYLPFSTMTCP